MQSSRINHLIIMDAVTSWSRIGVKGENKLDSQQCWCLYLNGKLCNSITIANIIIIAVSSLRGSSYQTSQSTFEIPSKKDSSYTLARIWNEILMSTKKKKKHRLLFILRTLYLPPILKKNLGCGASPPSASTSSRSVVEVSMDWEEDAAKARTKMKKP